MPRCPRAPREEGRTLHGEYNLAAARAAKNDEFYTQYHDVEAEMNAYLDYDVDTFRDKTVLLPCDDPEWSSFTRYFAARFRDLGLRRLISTSYAPESKRYRGPWQPTIFETRSPRFRPARSRLQGKIFTLDRDANGDGRIDIDDLQWDYLEGDGDFRSGEVTALRDTADIIITNPPFSLFREFLAWAVAGGQRFAVIGSINAITYKEVFPLIRGNRLWLGASHFNRVMYFRVPEDFQHAPTYRFDREHDGVKVNRVPGVCWFTNLEHGRRHEPLGLMTMADNLRFSRHREIRGRAVYPRYDNYDAIEVPYVDAIPSDYDGVMGVPIIFLDRYCPEQFEILGSNRGIDQDAEGVYGRSAYVDGVEVFKRLFIRRRS